MKKMKLKLLANDETFEKGFSYFILDCKARNLREGTLKHYEDSIKQIYKTIPPDTLISDIDITVVKQFFIDLNENPLLNDQSVFTYSRDLKTILRFFMREELLPYFEIQIGKADKTPIETYTEEELIKLLKKPNLKKCTFVEYRTWVIINFLLSTGVRQRSLLNVKNDDIDFSGEMINIKVTKNRKPIIIPMNEDIKIILKNYMKVRGGKAEDFLFCNSFGGQLSKSTMVHDILLYNRNRGVEHTGMHRFRHTFAKQWVLMGGNVVTLQKILGHSSLNITQNYLNMLVTDVKRDIDKFNILQHLKKESIKMDK